MHIQTFVQCLSIQYCTYFSCLLILCKKKIISTSSKKIKRTTDDDRCKFIDRWTCTYIIQRSIQKYGLHFWKGIVILGIDDTLCLWVILLSNNVCLSVILDIILWFCEIGRLRIRIYRKGNPSEQVGEQPGHEQLKQRFSEKEPCNDLRYCFCIKDKEHVGCLTKQQRDKSETQCAVYEVVVQTVHSQAQYIAQCQTYQVKNVLLHVPKVNCSYSWDWIKV